MDAEDVARHFHQQTADAFNNAFHANGGARPSAGDLTKQLIDPRTWLEQPPARRWTVEDWIPRGVVTGLYGDGGLGKSLLAQQLCTSVALSLPWLGLNVTPGVALGIFCEDSEEELQRRQWAINAHLGASPGDLGKLRYLARLGRENALMTFDGSDVGSLTPFADEVDNLCASLKPCLLVLDTIADIYPANENDRGKVRQFVQSALGGFARRHDCAVLVLGHPSVSGMQNGSGQSGSTAWNNTMRSRIYLVRPEDEDAEPNARILSRKKANYAARDAELKLTWRNGVIDLSTADSFAKPDPASWEAIDAMFDELERAWKAKRPWSYHPQTRKAGRYFPAWVRQHLGVPEKRVISLLSDWQMNGLLAYEIYDNHAKQSGLRVVQRLAR
ncbi:MAG TPA: AAA family ATPase [Roseomonas sp.]|nr:AAA family ATPase [Roseomonas sp.]